MNILLISECTKNALTETRRILDQFAERRGERTWQTSITQKGQETLRRLLRKTARKNTAVACHWIRGLDHSELLWIVGDSRQFNERGTVPTNVTRRNILRSEDENDWHSAETIRLLASIAALFHDFGKANAAFQAKIKPGKSKKTHADAYRHEWVSIRLFEAFTLGDSDDAWLTRLANLPENATEECLNQLVRDGLDTARIYSPFRRLRGLAEIVGWLIVSHHRLPTPESINESGLQALPKGIESHWCGQRVGSNQKDIADCWTFKHGLPLSSQHWRKRAAKVALTLRQHLAQKPLHSTESPYLLHLSRLALMLADHSYSSQPSHARYGDKVSEEDGLYANTDRKTGQLKQRLDEHLIGVEVNASRIVRVLPRLTDQLAHLVHRGFRQRTIPAFAWQNRAFEVSESLRNRSREQGFFGVNMASTGCGKTLANGRILYGLADPRRGARFTIALGLRTLTLQTGDAYRERLTLGDDEMAIMVGGAAVRELHQHQKAIISQGEATGSESSDALIPEYSPVFFEGASMDGPLNRWLAQSVHASKMLNAPLLICTIDHLMPACEGTRGGHQIPPMLRLMTSDLVLDEPDDFGIDDLPALSRLVHWAGMLGSRVLLSSATLPPALVEGLFEAYRAGRAEFAKHRGQPHRTAPICCAWFDEFGAEASEHGEVGSYRMAHKNYVDKRLIRLSKTPTRRNAVILPLEIAKASREHVCADFAERLQPAIVRLHATNHQIDQTTGKRVSIGLIRMANIDSLTLVARSLLAHGAPAGQHIHLCVYHSRHPLLVRSAIEQRLDRLLKRHDPAALFADAELRQQLDQHQERDHIFIVLATAVAEVGRDHDYDWAIVEPSSMRSIIQLAGRIRRHRPAAYEQTNLVLLDSNIKHLVDGPGKPAFLRPGFEHTSDKAHQLCSHRLTEVLSAEQLARIDATSRIRERPELHPQYNLIDLEHARLRNLMQGAAQGSRQLEAAVPLWWQTPVHLCGYLQKKQPFRHDPLGRQRYALLPDGDGEIGFYRIEEHSKGGITAVDHLLHPITITPAPGTSLWGDPDYTNALNHLAEQMNLDPADCARKYGTLELPNKGFEDGQGVPEEWAYSHTLGFWRWQ